MTFVRFLAFARNDKGPQEAIHCGAEGAMSLVMSSEVGTISGCFPIEII